MKPPKEIYEPKLDDSHKFGGDGNDYLCRVCKRPRAIHEHTDFTPKQTDNVNMDERLRFGGKPTW